MCVYVSPEIDSWHASSVHTYTLRSIGLLLDIGTYTPFVPFLSPSKKRSKRIPQERTIDKVCIQLKVLVQSCRILISLRNHCPFHQVSCELLYHLVVEICLLLRFYLHHMVSVGGDLNPDTSTTERDMVGLIHGPGVARSPLFTQVPCLGSFFTT